MKKQYHVYAHFTKDSGELFYIGCGRKGRINSGSAKKRNKAWHEIVDKHGFESEIIISFDNREEALAEELRLQIVNKPRACIVYGESKVIPKETRAKLSQSMEGNSYALGCKHTVESRRKRSESLKGHKRCLGYKHTLEARANMSEALKGHKRCLGYKHSLETRKKLSKLLKGNTRSLGFKHTIETRNKISESRKKPVINCRGEIFSSFKEAAKHFNLKSTSGISDCLVVYPGSKSAGKYSDGTPVKWEYYAKNI